MVRRLAALIALALLILTTPTPAPAQPVARPATDQKQHSQYLRLTKDDQGTPQALEVAVVRFVPVDRGQTGPTVDLVGAVHVADRTYYDQLNREFEKYDAVLYELVAPQGTRIPQGGADSRGNPVSVLQRIMKDVLELEFQLDQINYTRKNLVHADMSPKQFSESMRQRGESVLGIFLRMMGYAMARQSKNPNATSDVQLLLALLDKNRALALKRLMAEQFEDMEGSITALGGKHGSTLVTERNKVALNVLRRQLQAGKQKIAIFYGAGHMADMQQRLRDDFGLTPINTRWLVAWNLKDAPQKTKPSAQKAAHTPDKQQ